uniref:Putative ovule protein n=1 Tax=Solanum chacoense TaxID=4108 RepID=A0A0V0GXM6_SOLCH
MSEYASSLLQCTQSYYYLHFSYLFLLPTENIFLGNGFANGISLESSVNVSSFFTAPELRKQPGSSPCSGESTHGAQLIHGGDCVDEICLGTGC